MKLLFLCLAIGCAPPAEASEPSIPPPSGSTTIEYDFVATPLRSLTLFMADLTGRKIESKEGDLTEVVTMRTDSGRSVEQAWDHYVRVLNAYGYVVAQEGEAYRVSLGVTSTGPSTYDLDRTLLVALFEQLGTLSVITPHKAPDGQIDGYRLAGIRHGTVTERAGIRNGDVLHRIDGRGLTSGVLADDLAAIATSGDLVVIDLTSRGTPAQLRYTLR